MRRITPCAIVLGLALGAALTAIGRRAAAQTPDTKPEIGQDAVDAEIQLLASSDFRTRKKATEDLAHTGESARPLIEAVISSNHDPESEMRVSGRWRRSRKTGSADPRTSPSMLATCPPGLFSPSCPASAIVR